MNFQQLKIIRESARCNFNLTEVASMLYTSQSGVSRHIRELEDELGLEIFVRHGKRILGLTEPGKALLTVVERTLDEASNIRRIAEDFTQQSSGVLVIATTHTQARYSLPPVLKSFRQRFPQVRLVLNQGSPQEIRTMLHNGDADIGIASECLTQSPAIAAFPWFNWQHALLVPRTHPLVDLPITLENVSQFPLNAVAPNCGIAVSKTLPTVRCWITSRELLIICTSWPKAFTNALRFGRLASNPL